MRYVTQKDVVMPARKAGSHKGDNGKVLVIGGSEMFAGAVYLTAISALRSGTDLAVVAAPEHVAWAVNCLSPDLITIKLSGTYLSPKHEKRLLRLADDADVIALGNGAGLRPGTKRLFKNICKMIKKPKVIDADALKAVRLQDVSNAILTPHAKELEILLSNSNIKGEELQKHLKDNVILVKGKVDRIITKNSIDYNKTGNAGMTAGGTGDVLAGLCAGFLAQGLTLKQAAVNGAYYAGLCGDVLKKKRGFTYIASDLADEARKAAKKRF